MIRIVRNLLIPPLRRHPPPDDDLTRIKGVGPAMAEALYALGIRSFGQLAAQDAESLAARLPARISAARIVRERWIEQAHALRDEDAR